VLVYYQWCTQRWSYWWYTYCGIYHNDCLWGIVGVRVELERILTTKKEQNWDNSMFLITKHFCLITRIIIKIKYSNYSNMKVRIIEMDITKISMFNRWIKHILTNVPICHFTCLFNGLNFFAPTEINSLKLFLLWHDINH
jgi:hypothetical protein